MTRDVFLGRGEICSSCKLTSLAFPVHPTKLNSLNFSRLSSTFIVSMVSFKQCLDVFSFVFFLTSPLTSYGDQILAMRRHKSSHGFSIDVCGIMLVARYTP